MIDSANTCTLVITEFPCCRKVESVFFEQAKVKDIKIFNWDLKDEFDLEGKKNETVRAPFVRKQ